MKGETTSANQMIFNWWALRRVAIFASWLSHTVGAHRRLSITQCFIFAFFKFQSVPSAHCPVDCFVVMQEIYRQQQTPDTRDPIESMRNSKSSSILIAAPFEFRSHWLDRNIPKSVIVYGKNRYFWHLPRSIGRMRRPCAQIEQKLRFADNNRIVNCSVLLWARVIELFRVRTSQGNYYCQFMRASDGQQDYDTKHRHVWNNSIQLHVTTCVISSTISRRIVAECRACGSYANK